MTAPDRDELLERLQALPAAMRALPQWLVWRFVADAKAKKPRKVPYYLDGGARGGTREQPVEQGSEPDRKRLGTFDAALALLGRGNRYQGVGFAFLPGDGLVGIDIDHAIDAETGEVNAMALDAIKACATYTELSPSGGGMHIIGQGRTVSRKGHAIGLELFCDKGYFTCTGDRWTGTPAEAMPIADAVLEGLQRQIQQSKLQGRVQAADAAPLPVPAAGAQLSAWLEQALAVLDSNCDYDSWIGVGMALRSALGDGGLRLWDYWSSKAGERYPGLKRLESHWKSFKGDDADGALTIFKMARKGNRWRPPREWHDVYGGPRLVASAGARPAVAPPAQPEPDGRPEPPAPPGNGEPGGGGSSPPRGGGGVVDLLLRDYALVRGTDSVWDGEMRSLMAVKNLRLLYGAPYVNTWLAHPRRRVLLAEQIRFAPGEQLPEGCVNLFDKLPTEPVVCEPSEVRPMLDLLRHLTSLTGETPEQRRAVYRQVIEWCAIMVQQPGAKLRFAQVFHGPQGTGKNLFWDGFRAIFGKYGKMVGQNELDDRFNGYMSGKLLLIGNEVVTRQELFHNKNRLKWVITEDEIPIRGMHQEVRWEANHANLVFLSNELQPVALEKDDRRHLVVYTPTAHDSELYARVAAFLAAGGAAKFMHYLLQVPLDGFHEFTPPLMTAGKEVLIELGLKPPERFANEWLDGYLDLPVQVCSNGQLYRVFRRWCDQQGERWPAAQPIFTRTVERHVFERVERDEKGVRKPPLVAYKQIAVDRGVGPRKTMRCWVPRGAAPVAGISEGVWAAAAIDAFEAAVNRYGRTAHSEDEP